MKTKEMTAGDKKLHTTAQTLLRRAEIEEAIIEGLHLTERNSLNKRYDQVVCIISQLKQAGYQMVKRRGAVHELK